MDSIDRGDCFHCLVGTAVSLAIASVTVWGYFQDSSLYVDVRAGDRTRVSQVDATP